MHETHTHAHAHPERGPNWWSRALGVATVAGQVVVAAVQAAAGQAEEAWSAIQHSLHDGGDAIGYVPQVLAVNHPERSGERAHKIRKATYWFISASSVAVGVKTGSDALSGVLSGGDSVTESHASTYAVGASLALNTSVAATWYWHLKKQGLTKTVAGYDLLKHARTDISTALLAMAGVVAQRYYPLADEMAAALGAGYTAALFRPTESNLKQAHNHMPGETCGDHASEHEHEYVGRHRREDSGQEVHQPARKPVRRWRTALAAGVAAVSMLLGGASAGGEAPDEGRASPANLPVVPSVAPPAPQPQSVTPAEAAVPVTECVPVNKGDSMWRMSEIRIKQATGKQASAALTATVTRMTAAASRDTAPNPDLIFPGSCLTMPSYAVINGL